MKNLLALSGPSLLLVVAIGCNNVNPQHNEQGVQKTPLPSQIGQALNDIGDPDEIAREHDEIRITGSALTDAHIAAIRKLTDDTKPTKINRYLIRGIEHTGPNAAINIWQTGHSQTYQKLILKNGIWEIDEEGGGFGTW